MTRRVLSVHQEHEVLFKLEQAGLGEAEAQRIIESRGNALARSLVDLVRGETGGDWFTFEVSARHLQDLLRENRDIVYQEPWWKNERFAKERGQSGKRISIRLSAAPDSFRKNWSKQQATLREGEFVPTARDLLEGVILYYRATGKKLFTEYWVRTSTLSSHGDHFDLYWYPDGLDLFNDWDDLRYDDLGLAVARNS